MATTDSTQISTLVEIHGKQALTTSIAIAEGCELDHKQAIATVRKFQSDFEELGRVAFETRPFATAGGIQEREIAILNEDQATYLIMSFRNTPIVRRFKLALVKAFRKAINEINRLYANPPRTGILKAKRDANRGMMDAIVEARAELGKKTRDIHFMSESKLCNFIVMGKFETIDEKTLSNEDAVLLERVRDRNRAFLLTGLDYPTRKTRLIAYVTRERTKRIATTQPMALPVATTTPGDL